MHGLHKRLALAFGLFVSGLAACGPGPEEPAAPPAAPLGQRREPLRIGAQMSPGVPRVGDAFTLQAPDVWTCTDACNATPVYLFMDGAFRLTKTQSQVGTEDALRVEQVPNSSFVRLRTAYGSYLRLAQEPGPGGNSGFITTNVPAQATPMTIGVGTGGGNTVLMSAVFDNYYYSNRYPCSFAESTNGAELLCSRNFPSWVRPRGWVLPAEPNLNLALRRPAFQSSTYNSDGVASRAVDGNVDGNFGAGSVTHTGYEASPWWMVDLQAAQRIGRVLISNRMDCCKERLHDFYVMTSVDGASWQSVLYAGAAGDRVSIDLDAMARYVRIQLTEPGYLSLAEVQVFPYMRDIAIGKPTIQSTTIRGGDSARAVDGIIDGSWPAGSVTHTDSQTGAWWQVDLGSVTPIDKVVVFNRTDCCLERLSNFTVSLSADGTSWVQNPVQGPVAPVYVVNGGGFAARYVRLWLYGTNYLSLAEVQVVPR